MKIWVEDFKNKKLNILPVYDDRHIKSKIRLRIFYSHFY